MPETLDDVLEDALADVMAERKLHGYGVYLPANAWDTIGRMPSNIADTGSTVTHLVCADHDVYRW